MSAQMRTMADEGCRLTVYDDATKLPIVAGYTVKGNPTIGYGRLLCEPHGISSEEAAYLFQTDWELAETCAKSLPCYRRLNSTRQGVLVEMVFQLGIGGVREFAKMLDALDRSDYTGAANEMRRSKWAAQTPKRADRLADLMESST